MQQGDQSLSADFATIDAATDIYTADGNILLREKNILLRGDKISGNLFNGTAAIDSASFLLHQSKLRGTAKRISKTSDQILRITSGEFTTCEPGSNTWTVAGADIELKTAQGYGLAHNVTLKIKDVPIAYFPYFRFPIDDSRQSGFLMPSIGHDSDGGTDIAVPYYLNLAPNYDATYTLRSIWKRGVMHEGEFRYRNRYSKNLVAGTYLPSDNNFDDRTQIQSGIDGFEQQDRWMAHFDHKGRTGPWSSSINFTSVSDIDYFHDLGGFTNTKSSFDRGEDRSDSPALLRRGLVSYSSGYWRSTLELRSFQELSQSQAKQYKILPRLSLKGARKFGNVNASTLIQATEFDNSSDLQVEGSRIVVDGQMNIPFRSSWGFFTPTVRLLHRDYNLDETAIGVDDSVSITNTSLSLDMGLVFERAAEIFGTQVTQTLEPRLQYLRVNEEFQDDLPAFDTTVYTPALDGLFRQNRFTGYDRVGDENRVALGLTTNVTNFQTGKQLFTASIGQIFHFDDRQVNLASAFTTDPTANRSPLFTSFTTEFNNLRLAATFEYDAKAGESNRGYLSFKYRHPNNTVVNFNYIMTDRSQQRRQQDDEETDISFFLPLLPKRLENWRLIGRWNYGWDRGQTIESLIGVEYNDCCWKARVVFRRNLEEPRFITQINPGFPTRFFKDRRADSGIYFEFQLKGLTSLGGRLDTLLTNQIPGYRTD